MKTTVDVGAMSLEPSKVMLRMPLKQ